MQITFGKHGGLLLLGLSIWGLAQNLAAQPTATTTAVATNYFLAVVQGNVEVARGITGPWSAGQTNQVLYRGDRIRTGERSRAAVHFANKIVVELDETSDFVIPPSAATPHFRKGIFRLFERDREHKSQFDLPGATAGIRGTDFHVRVADDGLTEFTVMDGVVMLSNALGQVLLTNGEQAVVALNAAPRRTAVLDSFNTLIEWSLYYPGVLDLEDLNFSNEEKRTLDAAIAAYRSGDLLQATASYPWEREAATDAEKSFRAGLLLAVGQVQKAQALLQSQQAATPAAQALPQVIAAVKFQPWTGSNAPASASEWMAQSYYEQSRGRLREALKAAQTSVQKSTNFGFGWARVAELQFSFGRTTEALNALENALRLSPRHAQAVALKGYLLAAQNKMTGAISFFDQAIAIDGALGNAWLGRGLCRIRQGSREEGERDLLVAASLEPQRAVFRSYLGKAFSQSGDRRQASHELDLAKELDPNDPTSWLYSALHAQQWNRINDAVRDLERSQALNDNRRVYRSQLLLDQDRAVRSANLANIYYDAGMTDVSLREAVRAVNSDYVNYSAHLFLANSYDRLRDPKLINLRYETPAASEYLVANLLAPVGAGTLSPTISQQEYSKLFERNGLGLSSSTEYVSNGDWRQAGAQYGTFGNTSYSLEALYRSERGQRANNDLEVKSFSQLVRQQITPQDTVYLQAIESYNEGGNLLQYYLPSSAADTPIRFKETQEPLFFAGYHREWSPGIHTLFLTSRADDTLTVGIPGQQPLILGRDNGRITDAGYFAVRDEVYNSALEIYSVELQQIFQQHRHTTILGGRFQTGEFKTHTLDTLLFDPLGIIDPGLAATLEPSRSITTDFERLSFYGYHQAQVARGLQLVGGLAYDLLTSPKNHRIAPIANGEDTTDRVSPKAGLIWEVTSNAVIRAAYTRSLSGVSLDQSVQLEPTQVAGFNQAYRSLIPETLSGAVSGARFETYGISFEEKFRTGTYVGISGEVLNSKVGRNYGAIDFNIPLAGPATLMNTITRENLDFEEKTLRLTLNQLLSKEWALGVRYQVSEADLDSTFPEVPVTSGTLGNFSREIHSAATLHELELQAIYNHPCGFFGQFHAHWYSQDEHGASSEIAGDQFWQFNVFVGYRFPRRRAEIRLGLLNLTDQDYRLDPLNLYNELPRERMFVANLRFNF